MSKKFNLSEEDITTERMGRRGMLQKVGGSLLAGAAMTVVGASSGSRARAEQPEPRTSDSDAVEGSDPSGRGSTGHSDRDSGSGSDRAGHGVCAERGVSDSDAGGGSDPAGGGRGPCR